MNTKKRKNQFLEPFISLLIILFTSTLLYPQITVSQSEFMQIFTPGIPIDAIEGESGLINIGDTGGPNIYDFTFIDMQNTFIINNYDVSILQALAARYPSGAHTIGLATNNIDDNPVFYSSNDSTFLVGAATIEDEYRFTHYVPYELFSAFPIAYNSNFSQFIEIWDTTYDLSWQIIEARYYVSQQEMKVDGYGTLKLPGLDLECLRQKRDYADYGYKEFHYFTREGYFLVVSDVPINEPDTGIVNGDYQLMITSIPPPGVEDLDNIPLEFSLKQNYPNPFNPSTKISYTLPSAQYVNIKVFNSLGKLIKTLVDDYREAGLHQLDFNANGLPTGVYFYQLVSSNYVETKKMLLIK